MLIIMLNIYDDFTLGKDKKAEVSKLPVEKLKIKGERFFIDDCSPSTIYLGL